MIGHPSVSLASSPLSRSLRSRPRSPLEGSSQVFSKDDFVFTSKVSNLELPELRFRETYRTSVLSRKSYQTVRLSQLPQLEGRLTSYHYILGPHGCRNGGRRTQASCTDDAMLLFAGSPPGCEIGRWIMHPHTTDDHRGFSCWLRAARLGLFVDPTFSALGPEGSWCKCCFLLPSLRYNLVFCSLFGLGIAVSSVLSGLRGAALLRAFGITGKE